MEIVTPQVTASVRSDTTVACVGFVPMDITLWRMNAAPMKSVPMWIPVQDTVNAKIRLEQLSARAIVAMKALFARSAQVSVTLREMNVYPTRSVLVVPVLDMGTATTRPVGWYVRATQNTQVCFAAIARLDTIGSKVFVFQTKSAQR